jgi:hypothetical protein
MTDLSLAAQAVMDAYINNCGWLDGPFKKDYQCVAAVLRAAADQCHSQEIREADYTTRRWICVDELLAIAAELEGQ